MNVEKEIFKNGSTTYYWSSKFFPKSIRDDVFKLYSFVRIVDDYVDAPEPDVKSFDHMVHRWNTAKEDLANHHQLDDSIAERVLRNIVYVVHRFDCDPGWVDAFLSSMQMDIDKREYKTLDDTLEYIYGSAEVIGLFMAQIMGLPEEAHDFAKMQGRAMQFINFIRDIDEDITLGRRYFPTQDLKEFSLDNLSKKEAIAKPKEFKAFISKQTDRYELWQSEAAKGFDYIPRRLQIALKTAVDAYNWTGQEIAKNPMIIYEMQLKPSKRKMVKLGLKRKLKV